MRYDAPGDVLTVAVSYPADPRALAGAVDSVSLSAELRALSSHAPKRCWSRRSPAPGAPAVLAQTIVIVAMIAIFAASAGAGIAGAARARTVNAAKALTVPAIETALGRHQRYVAATIASQSPGRCPVPQPGAAAGGPGTPGLRHVGRAADRRGCGCGTAARCGRRRSDGRVPCRVRRRRRGRPRYGGRGAVLAVRARVAARRWRFRAWLASADAQPCGESDRIEPVYGHAPFVRQAPYAVVTGVRTRPIQTARTARGHGRLGRRARASSVRPGRAPATRRST